MKLLSNDGSLITKNLIYSLIKVGDIRSSVTADYR